jgi:hypothetical protein
MREIVLTGRKPGYRPKKRVSLNIHDWQMLSRSSVAEQFQFFSGASLAVIQEACCTTDRNCVTTV